MDKYKELKNNLRKIIAGNDLFLSTGIVKSVSGILCEVEIGRLTVPDVRLRASELDDEGELLLVPKIGSAVVVGSLTGDLSQLVVLQVDHVEKVTVTGRITVNGGELGGIIKIQELTDKLNELVKDFNSHTHTIPTITTTGGSTSQTAAQVMVPKPDSAASEFSASDYEDDQITH